MKRSTELVSWLQGGGNIEMSYVTKRKTENALGRERNRKRSPEPPITGAGEKDTPVLKSLRSVLRNADVKDYKRYLEDKYR